MTPDRTSVVIACYNGARFVSEAIESALNQSTPPLEIVVTNDASTDDTAAVLASYGERIRVVTHPLNRGEAAARNSAVEAARGDWIAVLDADDAFHPTRLERVFAAVAEHYPRFGLFTTNANIVEGDRLIRTYYTSERPFQNVLQDEAILRANFVFGQVVLPRETLLRFGGYDESIRYACDWEAWIRLILGGVRVHLIDELLADYRFHDTNASTRLLEMHADAARFLAAFDGPDLTDGQRRALGEALRYRRTSRDRAQLQRAARTGDPSIREAARVVMANPEQSPKARAKAFAALISPALAARAYRSGD